MKIFIFDQCLMADRMSLRQLEAILRYLFSNEENLSLFPQWIILTLIDEKLKRNEQINFVS